MSLTRRETGKCRKRQILPAGKFNQQRGKILKIVLPISLFIESIRHREAFVPLTFLPPLPGSSQGFSLFKLPVIFLSPL